MTDAELLEEIRASASVTRPEDDDGSTFFLLNRGGRLEAEVERLQGLLSQAWDRQYAAQREVERLRGVVAKARGHIEVMRECAEASLEHLEGLHRAPAGRAIREADRSLAELDGKG